MLKTTYVVSSNLSKIAKLTQLFAQFEHDKRAALGIQPHAEVKLFLNPLTKLTPNVACGVCGEPCLRYFLVPSCQLVGTLDRPILEKSGKAIVEGPPILLDVLSRLERSSQ